MAPYGTWDLSGTLYEWTAAPGWPTIVATLASPLPRYHGCRMPRSTVSASPPSYQNAIDFLFSRIDYERNAVIPYGRREFRLDRMRELLQRLDNPQDALKLVHVAGTKGKGSTAAMIAAVLTAAGYRTGLYSSPHLECIEERMAIDGANCPPDELAGHLERLRPIVATMDRHAHRQDRIGPTYFEITTAAALLHFAHHRVDAAVIEVGLGGRLDSTNVCRPLVSVITSISFDHMKQLGNTLAEIAAEKAGIIKPGVPVISGVQEPESRTVINSVRRRHGCTMAQLGTDFQVEYLPPHDLQIETHCGRLNFCSHVAGQARNYQAISLSLNGRHQANNAAVALATLCELQNQGWNIPEPAIRSGLINVRWPARVEVIARRPTVIVDAAHNTASIRSLLDTLRESFTVRKRWLIFATTQDKQIREMLELLLPEFDGVLLTRYLNNPRYVPIDELHELADDVQRLQRQATAASMPEPLTSHGEARLFSCADPQAALQQARVLAGDDDLICVTGSFFLAAEIRALL